MKILLSLTITILLATGCEKNQKSSDQKSASNNMHQHVETVKDSALMSQEKKETTYFCPMHPEIRQGEPGKCPICGMDLVLSNQDSGARDSVEISQADRRILGIKTEMIERRALKKNIRAIGIIEVDESSLAVISSHVSGRVEKQFADYTGVEVNKGDHLALVYSPDLAAAQEEYIQSKRTLNRISKSSSLYETQKGIVSNVKARLKELGFSENQLKALETRLKTKSRIEIKSPLSGTIVTKNVTLGQYIKPGGVMYKIANLDTVWVIAEVFPEDASLLHYGQKVSLTTRTQSVRKIMGRIAFISPTVDEKTRTIRVRIEVQNSDRKLRPGDKATVNFEGRVSSEENSKIYDPDLVGKWISPMHPQIIRDKPGKCPICGMDLVPADRFGFIDSETDEEGVLSVPRDAVLTLGRTHAVFIETKKNVFQIKKVDIGPTLDDRIVIRSGLEEFDDVASEGVYLLDSQLQLSGKTSLINLED